jgi:hypothetical protein
VLRSVATEAGLETRTQLNMVPQCKQLKKHRKQAFGFLKPNLYSEIKDLIH